MNKRTFKRLLSLLICLVLIAVAAFAFAACDKEIPEDASSQEASMSTDAEASGKESSVLEVKTVGEGETEFDFRVTDKNGIVTPFRIKTDKKFVGEALQSLGIIEGEEGAYGLYVKKVDGITADYDIDGSYWAFYINGSYAVAGIDKTEIEGGKLYELRVQK